MKNPKSKRKQRLRAKRRRIRRHNKRINTYITALYGLSALTQNFYAIGNALHKAMEQFATNVKPAMENIMDAHKAWEEKKLKSVGKNYFLQSLQAANSMPNNVGSDLVRRHRDDFHQRVIHPAAEQSAYGSGELMPLNSIIMDLNDSCGWTREEIADWLDTLDNQPIFYPNTCPDDCQESCCKTPTPTFFTDKITADTISSSKILSLPDVAYSYEIVDYDSINAYGFEDKFSTNCTYKGSITISDEWKMQQTPETLKQLHDFTQKHGVAYSHEFHTNSTTYEKEGSQAEVKAALYTVQQFLKGEINELPTQPCTCTHPGQLGNICTVHSPF